MTIEKTTALPVEVTGVRWGPDWDHMMKAAEQLGALGIVFEIDTASREQIDAGVDIMPELRLFDSGWRPHTVTFSQWVVVYPGERSFRVVNNQTYRKEYGNAEGTQDN